MPSAAHTPTWVSQCGVDAQQQGVVVEHLLEVRHHPVGVDAVAGEPTAELVVDAAAGHRLERPGGHLPGGSERRAGAGTPAPSTAGTSARHRSRRGPRRTRWPAAPPPASSVLRVDRAGAPRRAACRRWSRSVPATRRTSSPLVCQASTSAVQHLPERRLTVPRLVGEVGAGEERVAVVVEHDRHRPAAVPGHRRGRLHVDRVHVRPLLAVDLDADEVLVEVRRGRLVLERLVRHHVAPVARGVPDAQQHRVRRDASPQRTPQAPTPTSRPGCPRAEADTDLSHLPDGWPWPRLPFTSGTCIFSP